MMSTLTEADFTRIQGIAETANAPLEKRVIDGERRFTYLEEKINSHSAILIGDHARPGLVIIVDRLATSHANIIKLIWVIVGAVVSLLVGAIAVASMYLIRTIH